MSTTTDTLGSDLQEYLFSRVVDDRVVETCSSILRDRFTEIFTSTVNSPDFTNTIVQVLTSRAEEMAKDIMKDKEDVMLDSVNEELDEALAEKITTAILKHVEGMRISLK